MSRAREHQLAVTDPIVCCYTQLQRVLCYDFSALLMKSTSTRLHCYVMPFAFSVPSTRLDLAPGKTPDIRANIIWRRMPQLNVCAETRRWDGCSAHGKQPFGDLTRSHGAWNAVRGF